MVSTACQVWHPNAVQRVRSPVVRSKYYEGVVISDPRASLFEPSERAQGYRAQLLDFIKTDVYPAGSVYEAQMRAAGSPHHHPQIIEDFKGEARRRGLGNLLRPNPKWGPGLSNLGYAPSSVAIAVVDRAIVNMRAPIMWSALAARTWMSQHGGALVNIASIGGLATESKIGVYNASKAALIQFTRQSAVDWRLRCE